MKTKWTDATRLVVQALLTLVLALPGVVAAQAGSFAGEETVVAVEIPVQVLVDGAPVRGLTKDSFEVLEGRKRRPIVDFEVVDLRTATTETGRSVAVSPTVSRAGRRHFLLLFDLTNSEPQAMVRARRAATDLVTESLHPTDLVAVATWSFTNGPRLLLGFTPDRRQVEAAIGTLGVVDLRNLSPDPLGLIVAGIEGGTSSTTLQNTSETAGGYDAIFLENMRDFAANERAAARQVKQSEIDAFTRGTATLANLMSNVDGRKHVVLLSQGIDSSMLVGTSDQATLAQSNAAAISGEFWNVQSDEVYGSSRAVSQLEQMLGEFRRANCAIQAVDIGGLAAASDEGLRRPSGRDTLLTMASDTGGHLFENFSNLGEAMEEMLEATSVTYVLTIQPPDLKMDGKYHELKVRLANDVRGARLVHRPGYYAPKPFEERAAVERQLDTASLLVAGRPGGDMAASVAAAAFRGSGERTHVPVVIEIEGTSLLAAGQGRSLPLGIYVYAFDHAGTVRDFVAQSLELDLSQIGDRLAREPLKFVADLRVGAGSYFLRTLVRAGDRGSYWLGQDNLEVPAFAAGELIAVRPLAPEPMTSGVVVRSASSAERTQGLPFPFVLGQDFYLPQGVAQTAPGRTVRLCLNVYGLGEGEARIDGLVRGGNGQPVAGATVRVVGRSAADQPGLTRFELEVDPGRAKAGDYSVELSVEQAGRTASAAAALRVGA